jgi:hypothetical protein
MKAYVYINPKAPGPKNLQASNAVLPGDRSS